VLDKAVDRAMNSVRSLPAFPPEAKTPSVRSTITIRVRSEKNFSMKKKLLFLICSALSFTAIWRGGSCCSHQVDPLGFPLPIPVSISGYSGEVDSVLRFDLSFMGFEFVPAGQGALQYQKNNARVSGALINIRSSTNPLQQSLCRWLSSAADPRTGGRIAKTLPPHTPGIAQTRIAFKVQPTGCWQWRDLHRRLRRLQRADGNKRQRHCAAPCWGGHNLLFYMSHKNRRQNRTSFARSHAGARKAVAQFPGLNSSPAVSPDGRRLRDDSSANPGSADLW